MTRKIRVSEENFDRLESLAERLSAEHGGPASLDSAMKHLLKSEPRYSFLAFAGAWKMSDQEAAEVRKTLGEVSSTWRLER